MAERQGRIRALTAENASGATLLPIVKEHIMPSSTVFTDELPSYHGIPHMPAMGYVHRRINHSEKVYVTGDIHTNTVEGFWSLVKRGISGVYHSVGSTYLQSYLDEYSFRYNRRFDTKPMFTSFLEQVEKKSVAMPSLEQTQNQPV